MANLGYWTADDAVIRASTVDYTADALYMAVANLGYWSADDTVIRASTVSYTADALYPVADTGSVSAYTTVGDVTVTGADLPNLGYWGADSTVIRASTTQYTADALYPSAWSIINTDFGAAPDWILINTA